MVFVDEAKIYVKAGNGGNGCIAFRREKFVPRGGPSGGDGGHGGSIYLEANPHDNTLLRFRYNREFKADRGRHGEGSNCSGHSGADMILAVPVGTVVVDEDTGEQIADRPQDVVHAGDDRGDDVVGDGANPRSDVVGAAALVEGDECDRDENQHHHGDQSSTRPPRRLRHTRTRGRPVSVTKK